MKYKSFQTAVYTHVIFFIIIIGPLDNGEALKSLLNAMQDFFKTNFISSLMLIGCVILGIHYKKAGTLQNRKVSIPIVMAYGLPVSSKSTALGCALSIIGQNDVPMGGKCSYIFDCVNIS